MDATTAFQIGLKYSLDVFVTGYFAKSTVYPSVSQFWFGLALFTVGQIGNAMHHWLLAQLRRDPPGKTDDKAQETAIKEKNYVVPKGGLFSILVTPHYFFELTAIAGIVVISGWEPSMIGVFCFMTGYLAGRSAATQQWYMRNVKAWKQVHASRYRLIPYIW
jgi:very-long-chain enoyl-CoA reductase